MEPISLIIEKIKDIKKNLSNSSKENEKKILYNSCCEEYCKLIENYAGFSKYNESLLEKVYYYTKDLFNYYVEMIKLNNKNKEIIGKINDYMKNLITSIIYVSDLMDTFIILKDINRPIFYRILINFLTILNNEGDKKTKQIKYKKYFGTLYFGKAFYYETKFKTNLYSIDKNLKKEFDKQEEISKKNLNDLLLSVSLIDKLIEGKEHKSSGTGDTMVYNLLQKLDSLTERDKGEAEDILDIYNKICETYDIKEHSINQAFCLYNIVQTKIRIFGEGKDKLMEYIDKYNDIMKYQKVEVEYEWVKKMQAIITAFKK